MNGRRVFNASLSSVTRRLSRGGLTLLGAIVVSTVALLVACNDHNNSVTAPQPNPVGTPMPGATPTPMPAPQAATVNVGQGGGFVFVDQTSGSSTTTIKAGSMVTWNWVSGTHSTTSGNCCSSDGNWDSGIQSGGSFTHTFPSAGTFPYFCRVHGAMMTGMVVVQ